MTFFMDCALLCKISQVFKVFSSLVTFGQMSGNITLYGSWILTKLYYSPLELTAKILTAL